MKTLKTKRKTKADLEKDLGAAISVIATMQLDARKYAAEILTFKALKETAESDRTELSKVIFNIGFLVFGPDWLQNKSYAMLYDAVKDFILTSRINAGMYDGMRQAHKAALDKIGSKNVDNLQA